MLNDNRVFKVEEVASVHELAEKLTTQSWCLCNGFKITVDDNELIFLNDSLSEDGAAEYAIYRDGTQVESVTFGWIEEVDRAADLIRQVAGYDKTEISTIYAAVMPSLEHPEGSCELCA